MKLRELVEKIDNDIVLWIVRAPDTNVLFKRENASDVIPESLLCMEVGTFFAGYDRLHIKVKRNSRKGSFRELLNCLSSYACIDVYVDNRDGTKEKVYSNGIAFAISDKFDNYLVKRVSSQRIDLDSKIDIVIELCEEEDTQEGK